MTLASEFQVGQRGIPAKPESRLRCRHKLFLRHHFAPHNAIRINSRYFYLGIIAQLGLKVLDVSEPHDDKQDSQLRRNVTNHGEVGDQQPIKLE